MNNPPLETLDPPPPPTAVRRAWLGAEFALLFIGVPLLIRAALARNPERGRGLLPILWVFATGTLIYLLCDADFDRRCFFAVRAWRSWLGRALLLFLPAAAFVTLSVYIWNRPLLLSLPRYRPLFWALIMLLYPVLSVYPQGIIYRGFLFHRYAALFRGRLPLIIASAAAFSFMHIVFRNPVAPALTLAGGLLFAWTYDRTRSLLLAAAEHALYGCFVITIGLGPYFFHGTIRFAQQLMPR